MATSPQQAFRDALRARILELYEVDRSDMTIEFPPNLTLGDLATPIAFELARILKRKPRTIAEEILREMPAVPGIERLEVAGGGYLNVFFDRPAMVRLLLADLEASHAPEPGSEKVIVEHTNINPNKAAHIGHLRNAVLGDTLVRILRRGGRRVEVQNYIDDTGVQVADLVVGFIHLLGLASVEAVEGAVAADSAGTPPRLDYFCWDLYARVTRFYDDDKSRLSLRAETLRRMEEREGLEAEIASWLAPRIVRCHLDTMRRVGVSYDLLPWESHIIGLKFWARAFELLKERGAIRFVTDGDRAGCWVMDLPAVGDDLPEDPKIIVRSNGTVTYVGKDIAYQLWKTGLLGSDFNYRRFGTGPDAVWSTSVEPGEREHPAFGSADRVYNVIDVRQSYLQRVVQQGLRALGHGQAADRSHHFSYEMVALSPACARELGIEVEDERAHVEMSGRRGYGVKADDLIDALIEAARREVVQRTPDVGTEAVAIATRVAVGALRYFMIKFTRNKVIAFDFNEVLSFEGETGPYLLYSVVRARNIFNKMSLREGFERRRMDAVVSQADFTFLNRDPVDDHWELLVLMSRFDDVIEQAIRSLEPSLLARYAFTLAQRYNHFYHQFPVMQESDPGRKSARIVLTHLFLECQQRALDLMGIEIPERM